MAKRWPASTTTRGTRTGPSRQGRPGSRSAEALGTSEDQVRQEYRKFAEGQHQLWLDYEGKFGLDDAEYAAAVARSQEAKA